MEIDLVFKIAAIGIIVAVLNQLLIRSGREEQAMMTTLAGIVVVLFIIISMISQFFSAVKTMFML
mgnify:CR=1 FL=1